METPDGDGEGGRVRWNDDDGQRVVAEDGVREESDLTTRRITRNPMKNVGCGLHVAAALLLLRHYRHHCPRRVNGGLVRARGLTCDARSPVMSLDVSL